MALPEQPSVHQGQRDDEVGPVAECETGEQSGRDERSTAKRAVGVQRAHTRHHAPQAEGDGPFPRQRRQTDGGEHQERDGDGGDDARPVAPRPCQRVHREDDAEVLQQAEGALAFERVAEHGVPAGQYMQRERTVEVQEVDVGHVAGEEPLREDEHEALFHRAAGGLEQATDRDRHHGEHHQDRRQRPRPRTTVQATAEHEGIVGGRSCHDERC